MTHIIKKGFNQRSQSLHFRKGQYDPNFQSVPDESFLNGDTRDVQDGRYYIFDGIGSYIEGSGSYDIKSVYIKFNPNNTFTGDDNPETLVSFGNDTFGIELGGITGGIAGETLDVIDNVGGVTAIKDTITKNIYHEIFIVDNGTTFDIWLDGIKRTTYFRNGTTSADSSKFKSLNTNLGALLDTTRIFYDGIISTVKVWDEVLTASQINNHGSLSLYSGLKYFAKCDVGGNTNDFDSSGNGNNGTINNANLSTFHASGDDAPYSFQNNVGYTLSDGSTYYEDQAATTLIPQGVLIPRDESNPTKCTAFLSNGTQADLQYKGKVPYTVYAKDSNCPKYDGTGAYAEIPFDGLFNFDGTTPFSIMCRINTNVSSGVMDMVGRLDPNNNFQGYRFTIDDSKLRFQLVHNDNGTIKQINDISSVGVTDGATHTVIVTYDGSQDVSGVIFYVDGSITNKGSSINDLAGTIQNSLGFGVGWSQSFSGYFEGNLFDVRIKDSVLTSQEIADYEDKNVVNGCIVSIPSCEGNGNYLYSVVNSFYAEIKNASLTDFWSERQDVFHYNIEHGFDLWVDGSGNKLYVPFDENGNSIKTQGDTISGFSWDSKHEPSSNFHNGAETRFDTDANDPHFGDYKQAVSDTGLHPSNSISGDDRYYIRKLPDNEADRFTLYLNDQVDPQKLKTELFTQ